MRTYAILAALTLTAFVGAKDEALILRNLDGEYTVAAYTDQGKEFLPEELRSFKGVKFDGDKMIWMIGETAVTSTVQIDSAAGPNAMDLTADSGFMKGKTYKCLVEIRNGQVTLAMPVLPGVARPKGLQSTLESRTATMVLKKVGK